jgi:tetratricopeptide (TPR) repeat protein
MPATKATYAPSDYLQAAREKIKQRKPMEAYSICVVGLEQHPTHGLLMCQAAQACIALGHLREARLYTERARSEHIGLSLAHELYGDLCLLEGSPGEAVKAYRQAERLDVNREVIRAKIEKARSVMNQKRPMHGKRKQQMGFPEEMARAGRLERDGEPGKAENIYRDILRRDPEHVEAIRMLAAVASRHKKYADAEVLLTRATEIAPDYARIWLDLAGSQLEQEKLESAIHSARTVVELAPDVAESHIALGNALGRADLAEEALAAYRAALGVSVGHPGAFSGVAQQLKTLGRQEEAIEAHRENLKRNPGLAEPYWSLANMKTFRFTDQDIASMEMLVVKEDQDELSVVQLCNALGFAYEGRGEYDRAFEYFQRGNDKRRESEIYDPVDTEVTTDRYIKVFNPLFMARTQGQGVADAAPIFIVGLPRSGSTLIEQILASHSQVEGTHELSDLAQVVRSLPRAKQGKERFPDNLPGLKPHFWEQIGSDYLQRTLKYRQGAPYFIDKNPNNFVYAGLIQLILPNARIINARRHPLDSCFGSYKQLFASGQPFTYDLTEIGEYYLQYQRLMDHWHELMPGRILDVQYEDVVADLDTQVRRILDYCDLPFEEGCLRFHETERAVKTASSEQVRQPIYSSSVNLWQRYEQHLEELVEVLEPVLGTARATADSRPIG